MPCLRSLVAVVAFAASVLPALRAQTTELRAVWVARDGLTSRQQIVATLDQLAAANLNVVCVNCWSRGFTIHPSSVLQAACGQGQDPSFVGRDPLAEFVLEAHRRGIEVEAWFEYGFLFGWSGWHAGPSGTGPVLGANPGWIGRDNTGNTQVSDGNGGYFTWASHEHPAVRQFLIDLAVEVVDRYDIDGIQFDRVRYPSTSFGYDPATSAAWQAYSGQAPPANVDAAAWKRWRADRLIAFHHDLYTAVKARRASVRVTDAPTVMPGAYDTYLQDWPAWLQGGSLDLVYPQVYRTTAAAYITTLDQQLAYFTPVLRQRIAPGIRAITGTPTGEVLGMVAADRVRALAGHVFWYAEGLYDDLPALTAGYFQNAAVVPQRPTDWRPIAVQREENGASTTSTPGFVPVPLPGASGGLARIAPATASANDVVTYSLPVGETGLWSVLVWAPGGSGYASAALHEIATAAGPVSARVDQSRAVLAWRELTTVWLSQGVATVQVHAMPGQAVLADAIGLVRSRWPCGAMATIGSGTGGSLGGLRLAMSGRSGLGGSVQLQASRLPPGTPTAIGIGAATASLPLFGGTLLVVPDVLVAGLADAQGLVAYDVPIPWAPSLLGRGLFAQALALDAVAPGGIGLSAGVGTSIL